MAAMRNKETLLLSSQLLALLVLGLLLAPSHQAGDFDKWVTLQQTATVGKPGAGGKQDPQLTSAEDGIYIRKIVPGGEGQGFYGTIGQAVTMIPKNNSNRYVIDLPAGSVFREKVFISKNQPFVTIRSDPKNPATIVWNDTATTAGNDGKPLGTVGSSTVTVESDYFIAYGVVFKNDAPLPKPGAKKAQAPALRVSGTKATLFNCTIDGGQVALYDQKGLHYYKACNIKGTVDFIFGFARSLYEECNIISVNKEIVATPKELPSGKTSVDAPNDSRFSFKNCVIKGEAEKVYLGRVLEGSRAVYSYTQMGNEVVPVILDRGNLNSPKSGTYYGTFKCSGPGSDAAKKDGLALELTEAQVKPFVGTDFVSGNSWILALPPRDQ